MLDARIDASSTQRLASAGRFTAKDVEWMISSSHGLVLEEDIAIAILNRLLGPEKISTLELAD
jgi:hypothetical protein